MGRSDMNNDGINDGINDNNNHEDGNNEDDDNNETDSDDDDNYSSWFSELFGRTGFFQKKKLKKMSVLFPIPIFVARKNYAKHLYAT